MTAPNCFEAWRSGSRRYTFMRVHLDNSALGALLPDPAQTDGLTLQSALDAKRLLLRTERDHHQFQCVRLVGDFGGRSVWQIRTLNRCCGC